MAPPEQAATSAPACPPVGLFVRGKPAAKALVIGTPKPGEVATLDALQTHPTEAFATYSADGSCLAVVEKTGVRVLNAATGAEAFAMPRPQVQALSLSPRATFLLTWERMQEGDEATGNLRVWRVATGELACSWHQKVLGEKALWPALHWSVDEAIALRLVTNEVHCFNGLAPTPAAEHKLRIENVMQCSIEPTAAPHHIATFVPEKKGAPAVLRLWQHPDFGEGRFLATKSFFKADQVAMRWRPTGGALLVHTHTDVDTTGKSYMGETGLYYMPLDGKKVLNVTLRKEGAIHDVQWSPLGDEFICIFGVSPPEACIFNLKCEVTHSFGEAPRNTVSWAPHGRFLCLAGFGNMSGELSFYDRKSLKCMGTVDAHMTVNYGWSPCSRYFLTAILFPRLRVDNGFRVWSCAGGLLHQERMDELTLAMWRPMDPSLFPPPTDADVRAFPAAASAPKPTSQATKYVPPGQRAGASASGLGGKGLSLSDLAAATGGGGAGFAGVYDPHAQAGSGRSLSALAAAQEAGGSAALRRGPPPGSEPVEATSGKPKQKQKAKDGSVPTPPPPAPAGAESDPNDPDAVGKKVRAVEKKLRQIAELKELKAGGKPLEKNQLDKIEQEPAIKEELAALQAKLTDKQAEEGKWR
jgi:translation initiation factor 2A